MNGCSERLDVKLAPGEQSAMIGNYEGVTRYIMMQQDDEASENARKWAGQFVGSEKCPTCKGTRLNREALHYVIDGINIAKVAEMDLVGLNQWVAGLEDRLDNRQRIIAVEILKEIRSRIQFLLDVGLEYLSLNRAAATLSGGESQRIRLATQIGSKLVNVLYILDEPSIGLHQRDNLRLIHSLKQLRDGGNSVIVV